MTLKVLTLKSHLYNHLVCQLISIKASRDRAVRSSDVPSEGYPLNRVGESLSHVAWDLPQADVWPVVPPADDQAQGSLSSPSRASTQNSITPVSGWPQAWPLTLMAKFFLLGASVSPAISTDHNLELIVVLLHAS